VFYDIKWISFWIWKKNKNKTIHKNRSRSTKIAWYLIYNKTITALHFVQYDVLWSTRWDAIIVYYQA
jgi:hypothetical protein